MNWQWLPDYAPAIIHGFWVSLMVLAVSVVVGLLLALPLAAAMLRPQSTAGRCTGGFCSLMRGTPLLMQIYLLYYGLGSLFPLLPHDGFAWLIRLDAIYYVLLAFSLNFAGYEAEVLRGGLLAVPKGELESALALGMGPGLMFRRIWLPAAVMRVLPVLGNDVVAQLKSTPLAFTVPVVDLMGAAHRVIQDTGFYYEPLLLVAVIYVAVSVLVAQALRPLEARVRRMWPQAQGLG